MQPKHSFTIRVYGLLIQDKHILVSHERFRGKEFTKFPGGGLEFGESPSTTLQREFAEELGLGIRVEAHFYTTDLVVFSAFDPTVQVMSLYYTVSCSERFEPEKRPLHPDVEKDEVFEFVPLENLTPDLLSFPIDQHVGQLLRREFI